jgi:hypothetical protein
MRAGLLCLVAPLLLFAAGAAAETRASLDAVKAESNPEKRARLATDHARASVKRVAEFYREGKREEGAALLREIQQAVELTQESLEATGKPAHKMTKHYKRAEIQTRRLLGELDDLDRKLDYDEREELQAVRARVEQVNRELLMAIMAKKKKT